MFLQFHQNAVIFFMKFSEFFSLILEVLASSKKLSMLAFMKFGCRRKRRPKKLNKQNRHPRLRYCNQTTYSIFRTAVVDAGYPFPHNAGAQPDSLISLRQIPEGHIGQRGS